jgi:hypothetical protein
MKIIKEINQLAIGQPVGQPVGQPAPQVNPSGVTAVGGYLIADLERAIMEARERNAGPVDLATLPLLEVTPTREALLQDILQRNPHLLRKLKNWD